MAISDHLTIHTVSSDAKKFHFECIGSIDINAEKELQILQQVPEQVHVVLDFKQIERVNSMGLSLLLKIFEDWEQRKITLEVKNLNRMVSMLFKITGLGRFVNNEKNSKNKAINPQMPIHANRKKIVASTKPQQKNEKNKLNFVASLQSGQQLTGWYLLNTYLQRNLQKAIHFEQLQDVNNDHEIDLLFAKPFESCEMILNKRFVPVLRPQAEADEVVIISRIDDKRSLPEFTGCSVVTASEQSFVYILGRFLCDETGIDSSQFQFQFSGNEIKSLQMLLKKKVDLLFMLKKTYEGLSSFSKKGIKVLDESATDFAFHFFSVAPHLSEKVAEFKAVLSNMRNQENGAKILEDIVIEDWCNVEKGELDMMMMVFERYNSRN